MLIETPGLRSDFDTIDGTALKHHIKSGDGEVLEREFVLGSDTLRLGLFKKHVFDSEILCLTDAQLVHVQHIGKGDMAITRIAYSEVDGLELDESAGTLWISMSERGRLNVSAGRRGAEIVEAIRAHGI